MRNLEAPFNIGALALAPDHFAELAKAACAETWAFCECREKNLSSGNNN